MMQSILRVSVKFPRSSCFESVLMPDTRGSSRGAINIKQDVSIRVEFFDVDGKI